MTGLHLHLGYPYVHEIVYIEPYMQFLQFHSFNKTVL